ncbi:hypothetical protein IV102_37995 [bacterium]|nr:hypothetical protein [bacterium]
MLANFVRTLYYSNYYPLAEIVLVGQGDEHQRSQWVTELGFSTRYGENGKAYLFLPHCYWKGNADSSSCRMSNVILFNAALIILFLNGCRLGYPTLAGIVVMLVGSNPFQVQEVQAHSNVFSWSISVAILALAMHLGYLLRPGPARVSAYLGAAGFGFLLATVRQVRTEPTVIMISVVAAILLNFKLRFRNRVALIVVLLGSLSLAQAGWKSYFAFKINQAEQVCRERGGVPYSGPRDDYHILWHPLWCGLGDYGQDRGYAWDDAAAWRYVQTILLKDYHISVNFDKSGYYLDSNWDNQPAYPRLLTEYPQCEPITRAKVVADIRENPVWYGIILLRRLNRVLRETTPIRLTWAERSLSLPFSGWICVPLLLLLAMARSRLGLLILFVAPTSMTSILVYSGRGTCLYSVFHILGAGLLLAFLLEALLQWKAPARGVA